MVAGLFLIGYYWLRPEPPTPTPIVQLTPTRSATLTPTQLPSVTPTVTPSQTPSPTVTPSPPPTLTATTTNTPTPGATVAEIIPAGYAQRFGVNGIAALMPDAAAAGLPIANYLDWTVNPNPLRPEPNSQFWQLINLTADGWLISPETLQTAIMAQPGAIWIIGNEPDVIVQDNLTPAQYVQHYHDLYTFIKSIDPTAQVAIAGVAQPTPLRMAYLTTILDNYRATFGQPMPIDIWTVHAFILNEASDSWGAGIPPGINNKFASQYTIEDHDNLTIFKENLIAFRAWLAEQGYRDRPLVITEFGLIMPTDFGFPPERIATFLQGSFDFLLTATDEESGYPADDNHLVQWWFWFSLYESGDLGAGNLFDPQSGELTQVGLAYRNYVNDYQP